jgi:hypothetical protein
MLSFLVFIKNSQGAFKSSPKIAQFGHPDPSLLCHTVSGEESLKDCHFVPLKVFFFGDGLLVIFVDCRHKKSSSSTSGFNCRGQLGNFEGGRAWRQKGGPASLLLNHQTCVNGLEVIFKIEKSDSAKHPFILDLCFWMDDKIRCTFISENLFNHSWIFISSFISLGTTKLIDQRSLAKL